ncbi:MAG: hypothetical protein K2X87_06490 [Gemmataceae bacterium]|nr:hypothetical protein [Gemmataceae bacterium]
MPFVTRCPDCREPLDVDDEYRTWRVRCPRCRHEFVPDGPAETAPRRPAPPDDPAPRRESRPRPDRLPDGVAVEHARRAVAGPAGWLRACGVLGMLTGAALGVGTFALGAWAADNPVQARKDLNARDDDEVAGLLAFLGAAAAGCVVAGGVITYGAVQMGRLGSYRWAVASAVTATGSVAACGLVVCCAPAWVPVGIWGLVALNRPEVRDGFAAAARDRGHGYDDGEAWRPRQDH